MKKLYEFTVSKKDVVNEKTESENEKGEKVVRWRAELREERTRERGFTPSLWNCCRITDTSHSTR